MAHIVLKDVSVYAGGYDLTGDTNSVALDYGADMVEDTVFRQDTHGMRAGLKTVSFSMEGYTDGTHTDTALYDQIGLEDLPLTAMTAGPTEGNTAYSFLTAVSEFQPANGAVGEMAAYSASAAAMGDLIKGYSLANVENADTTGATTGVQAGAATATQTIYAAIHVLNSGTGTLDAVIESDDNAGFTSPVTRFTFTQATGVTSEWLTLAGPVTDDYWRVSYTIAGADPDFTFIVFFGIL
jgi:hypothetical protein